MKHPFNFMIAAITAVLLFASCRKNDVNDNNGLPTVINTIVSQAIIDSLTNWGLTINKGTTPTQIAGIYFLSKNICTYDNAGTNTAGKTYDDYKAKFANQDNNAFTVSVGLNNVSHLGTDSSYASTATFISGNGNLFTVFSQQTGVSYGIKDTALFVYSGEITTTGIKNFQTALYMKGKSTDIFSLLIKVGSCRIFKDGDGLSELSKNYNTDSPQGIAAPVAPSSLLSNKGVLSTAF